MIDADVRREREDISKGWNDYERRTMRAAVEWLGEEAWLYDAGDFVLYDEVNDAWELGAWWAVESGLYEFDSAESANAFDLEGFGMSIARRVCGEFTSLGFVELRR